MSDDLRIGHGYDLHRLKAGGRLVIAGVVVSDQFSPIAHSDGDVAFHALVDALLGAMGWGDIGEMFSNSDPRWKDADSGIFVRTVRDKMAAEGFAPRQIDLTILAERPKLKNFKPRMLQSLHEHFPKALVNIKAGTNEGCDAIGRGEAIAAHAIALVARMN